MGTCSIAGLGVQVISHPSLAGMEEPALVRAVLIQMWLPGSRAQAQQLWQMGSVALRHVRPSRTRAGTCVCCVGRWTLYHWAIREGPTQQMYQTNCSSWACAELSQGVGARRCNLVDQHPFAGRSGCTQSLAATCDAATRRLSHMPELEASDF